MIDPAELQRLYVKYSKEKVEEALAYLSYRKADPLPKDEKTDCPTLYVFRHGQTVDNANYIFCGWRDPDLTESGIKQAEVLADKFKDKAIHMLISSDQQRAIKTMQLAMSKNPYAKELEIIKDPRIKEKSYGDYQGKSKLEMELEDPEKVLEIRRNYYEVSPNGESIEMVVKRVNEFLDEIIPMMKEHKINVAVSCHGNSIRGIRQRFENLTNEETAVIETPLGQDYAAYAIC